MSIGNSRNNHIFKSDGYIPGGNHCICDICGFKYRAFDMRYNYNGLLVCKSDYEPRHPQDTIRAVKEKIVPKKVRPRQSIPSFTNSTTQDDL